MSIPFPDILLRTQKSQNIYSYLQSAVLNLLSLRRENDTEISYDTSQMPLLILSTVSDDDDDILASPSFKGTATDMFVTSREYILPPSYGSSDTSVSSGFII
jgi:hypothetical protein